jgi:hypothetical protein
MGRALKIWTIAVIILGILSVVFTFYKTVIKNDYITVNPSTEE